MRCCSPGNPSGERVIVVVGGGVMGCTLTYRLAAQGRAVTLLERAHLGHGASGVPLALLNPYRGRSARASPFDLEGLGAMWRLVNAFEAQGLETGVRRSGVLRIASNARQAKTWRQRAHDEENRDGRDPVQWLEPEAVPDGYHAPFGGFIVPQGGWLEPEYWLRALASAATARGATLIESCEVQGIHDARDGFTLQTTHGTFAAETVVLTSGSDVTLGQDVLGLEHVAGEVIGLRHSAPFPYPLAGAVYGGQRGETFYLGGNHRPAHQSDEDAPRLLQSAGSWFIPSLRGAPLVSVWEGVRTRAGDSLPLITPLRPGFWFVGALAGRGFLCAANVAEEVATAL